MRFLKITEVIERTSLPRSTIYHYVAIGVFPRQVKIGPNRVVWREDQVERWQRDRIRQSGGSENE